jgi:hypothetical protein
MHASLGDLAQVTQFFDIIHPVWSRIMSTEQAANPGQTTLQMVIPQGLQIEYANLVRIAHSPSEMIFDFAHLLPGTSSAQISSRIIMSPIGAKLFMRALSENIVRYEAAFGEINLPGASSLADNLFHGIDHDEP